MIGLVSRDWKEQKLFWSSGSRKHVTARLLISQSDLQLLDALLGHRQRHHKTMQYSSNTSVRLAECKYSSSKEVIGPKISVVPQECFTYFLSRRG